LALVQVAVRRKYLSVMRHARATRKLRTMVRQKTKFVTLNEH